MLSVVRNASPLLLLATLFSPLASLFAASFNPLGDLPGGTFASGANGVSQDGSVIVGGGLGTNGPEGYRWTSAGGMVGLGRLLPGTIVTASATSVSNDGQTIAGIESTSGGLRRSYRWTAGSGLVNLGALPGGGVIVLANAVNSLGDIYGISDSTTGTQAFFNRSTDNGMFTMGNLPNGFFYSGVNDVAFSDGVFTAVGFVNSAGNTNLGYQAAVFTPGGNIATLGDLTGGVIGSEARAISESGAIVGFGTTAAGAEAFRYTFAGGMVSLGDLPGGDVFAGAQDISADGNVVVGYGSTAVGVEAFVWGRSGAGMENLRDLLSTRLGAPALQGWRLTAANAVSGNGRVVAGEGLDPQGNQQAWSAVLPLDQVWDGSAGNTWENAANWVSNFAPAVGDVIQIDNTLGATVQGPTADSNIHQLLLGYLNPGSAALALTTGDLTMREETIIGADGTLTIPVGRTLTGQSLRIDGVVKNAGRIVAPIQIGDSGVRQGVLRTLAGETGIVESTLDTYGRIEVMGTAGSPAEFQAYQSVRLYQNPMNAAGQLAASDATLRFFGGLENQGVLSFDVGDSNVYGAVNNQATTGLIYVDVNAKATFFGTVTQSGSLIVAPGGEARFDSFFIADQGGTGGGDVVFQAKVFPGGVGPGSVTFVNNVTLTDATTLIMNIGGTMSGIGYDILNVSGNLSLGGTLLVGFEAGYTPNIGDMYDLLNWSSAVGGAFRALQLQTAPGLAWDVSQLYMNGQIVAIAAPALPGDYNNDGKVDAADYTRYRDALGTNTILPNDVTSGLVTLDDFDVWTANYGALPAAAAAVPEPAAVVLLLLVVAGGASAAAPRYRKIGCRLT